MKSALKWLLFLPFFIFFFLFLKTPVIAATYESQPANNQYLTPVTNNDVPKNMHTYTQSVVLELMASAICQLSGYDPLSQNHECLGIDTKTNKIGFVENGGGLIGATGGLIAMTFHMPTSSSQYVNYLASNFGFSKKAYAQTANTCTNDPNGAGFCSIKPLTNIWAAMRNIVYLLFTVVFTIIGFAIMLRLQIDPRTVMTVENQIPKIIVGLILVTFSLAIAGLLIDIMYVAIYLIGNILTQIPGSGITESTFNSIATAGSPLAAKDYFGTDVIGGVAQGVANLISANVRSIFEIPLIGDVGKWLLGVILFLIFLLAFWISLIRVWLALIFAYITILLDIVFAPFWFVLGLLPGGSLGVGAWFRDILANLAVFPATIAMFSLAIIFGNIGDGQPLFNPPLVASTNLFTLGKLITFGFIFMTPQVLSIMKATFKAPKISLGPVFQPAATSAASFSTLPRRFISAGERIRYARDSSGGERLQRLFGSPYYRNPGRPGSGEGH